MLGNAIVPLVQFGCCHVLLFPCVTWALASSTQTAARAHSTPTTKKQRRPSLLSQYFAQHAA